jgi:hypothetical protein
MAFYEGWYFLASVVDIKGTDSDDIDRQKNKFEQEFLNEFTENIKTELDQVRSKMEKLIKSER